MCRQLVQNIVLAALDLTVQSMHVTCHPIHANVCSPDTHWFVALQKVSIITVSHEVKSIQYELEICYYDYKRMINDYGYAQVSLL